ncbi:MAG: 2,3-bisphosphoglycerate-independent phosphoglycerate mutase [Methylacidiphilales bacterium]|nr:2,3-bisphosphoglycerate-independent phosphoglycerate mutase [Candidatus Methylacidiphilales bacterium]
MKIRRKVLLIILDGVGCNPNPEHNGIALASIPFMKSMLAEYPHTTLEASGLAVGLPDNQMGSSEIGHALIGSGIVLEHDLVRISKACQDHSIEQIEPLQVLLAHAKKKGELHLLGLVSDGGVHSHIEHLVALITLANTLGIRPIVHAITDGRDTPPMTSIKYLERIDATCKGNGGMIASVSGRYYAMDRDNRVERTEKAYATLTGDGVRTYASWLAGIQESHANNVTDEFIEPFRVESSPYITKDSALLYFNFRVDRMRQISNKFHSLVSHAVSMTQIDPSLKVPYLFGEKKVATTLGKIISDLGLNQLRCAESEKFAHITYFFNNGKNDPYEREERIIIPSPKVASYDLAPEMSAKEITKTITGALTKGQHHFIAVNYANGDMVGHTANRPAILQAIECLDNQLATVISSAIKHNYSVVLTADHGNCDEMVDSNNQPHTQHSLHPVPCIVIDPEVTCLVEHSVNDGLKMITPTICSLMGIDIPSEVEGRSLVDF